jgi:hypothetical protein
MQCVGTITESQDASLISKAVIKSYNAIEALLLSAWANGKKPLILIKL